MPMRAFPPAPVPAAAHAPAATALLAVIKIMPKHLVIATRGSALALWQAEHVRECLREIDSSLNISLNVIKTKGDIITDAPLAQIGGKGLFVKEIEQALLDGRADLAVHSIKDVPMNLPEGLIIGCIPKREAATDCFLSETFSTLDNLPEGASVGTSSLRRQAQLLARRPDLNIVPMRGNVDTRLKKLKGGDCAAIILATAGLFRLGLHARYMQPLETDDFIPAVGQGALGIECHEDNYQVLTLLAHLEDRDTRVCVQAERAFLRKLDGGCQTPIAGHAKMLDEENLVLEGLLAEPDGSVLLRGRRCGDAIDAERMGAALADELLDNGASLTLQKPYF